MYDDFDSSIVYMSFTINYFLLLTLVLESVIKTVNCGIKTKL